ncbi:hypothetical protein PVAP13_3KG161100 [Panicum virgatum]|uniref:Uncharacterized protein n=1 Tax=Panicum virgatum TaxID=38727 RepID=A0A8T0USC1_PANVG|nr:hypothetical protein PVAP13_3KG161100 [Panicum virgatum]
MKTNSVPRRSVNLILCSIQCMYAIKYVDLCPSLTVSKSFELADLPSPVPPRYSFPTTSTPRRFCSSEQRRRRLHPFHAYAGEAQICGQRGRIRRRRAEIRRLLWPGRRRLPPGPDPMPARTDPVAAGLDPVVFVAGGVEAQRDPRSSCGGASGPAPWRGVRRAARVPRHHRERGARCPRGVLLLGGCSTPAPASEAVAAARRRGVVGVRGLERRYGAEVVKCGSNLCQLGEQAPVHARQPAGVAQQDGRRGAVRRALLRRSQSARWVQ